MRRRDFIQTLGASALAGPGTRLWAANAGQPRFLLIFLRGGYDAASLLVPTSSSFYYESRPEIAIARPSADLSSALPLNTDWGLHPALRESLWPLWQQKELAFVPFAGTHDTSRSHFETQDSMELGQSTDGPVHYGSGFLNRLASHLQQDRSRHAAPMAFTDQLPIAFQGSLRVPNMALRNLAKPSIDARQSNIIAAMYQGQPMGNTVSQGFAVRDQILKEMASEMDAASRNAITAKGFELEARRIAKLMREQYALGFVDVGGWDTHVAQGAATGYLASRFDELGHGLAAFANEMGNAWRDTVVVVMSEFGRTLRQNGNRGTDHGHGSVMWVLGGGVRGQRIVGAQQTVTAATLFQNRDYPVLNDYRTVLAELFARQWGLNSAALQTVFPGLKASYDLDLV